MAVKKLTERQKVLKALIRGGANPKDAATKVKRFLPLVKRRFKSEKLTPGKKAKIISALR